MLGEVVEGQNGPFDSGGLVWFGCFGGCRDLVCESHSLDCALWLLVLQLEGWFESGLDAVLEAERHLDRAQWTLVRGFVVEEIVVLGLLLGLVLADGREVGLRRLLDLAVDFRTEAVQPFAVPILGLVFAAVLLEVRIAAPVQDVAVRCLPIHPVQWDLGLVDEGGAVEDWTHHRLNLLAVVLLVGEEVDVEGWVVAAVELHFGL